MRQIVAKDAVQEGYVLKSESDTDRVWVKPDDEDDVAYEFFNAAVAPTVVAPLVAAPEVVAAKRNLVPLYTIVGSGAVAAIVTALLR